MQKHRKLFTSSLLFLILTCTTTVSLQPAFAKRSSSNAVLTGKARRNPDPADISKKTDTSLSYIHAKTAVNKYKLHKISFPASDYGLTRYNTELFDNYHFSIRLSLPFTWELSIPEKYTGDGLPDGHSPVLIRCGKKQIGTIDYDSFDPNGMDALSSDYYRMIYSQIMSDSVASWDYLYTPIKQRKHFESATCRIWVRDTDPKDFVPGILAYDNQSGVYIKISFLDPGMSDTVLAQIANTISFSHQ